jgi:hypothetical protein
MGLGILLEKYNKHPRLIDLDSDNATSLFLPPTTPRESFLILCHNSPTSAVLSYHLSRLLRRRVDADLRMGSDGGGKIACIYDSQVLHAHNLGVRIDGFAHGTASAWSIKAEAEVANALVEDFVG